MSTYPDYSKAPDGYLLAISQTLAMLEPDMVEAILNPLTGVSAKCKFLPTRADILEFVEARRTKFSVTNGDSGYARLTNRELDRVEPLERRKAAVIEALGYDPAHCRGPERRPLEPGIRDAVEDGSWSISMLKSPPKPPSRELIELLTEQGYFDESAA